MKRGIGAKDCASCGERVIHVYEALLLIMKRAVVGQLLQQTCTHSSTPICFRSRFNPLRECVWTVDFDMPRRSPTSDIDHWNE